MAAVLLVLGLAGPDVIRTGDITVRGLTAGDFPRVQRLATNVYTFEQIDPTKRTVTVNNLIVTSESGVLVAEGQGTDANVALLKAAVARLTAQPIKYVVVGSEHGDHTGGDAAFGPDVTFLVHPKSKGAVERRLRGPIETVADTRVLRLGTTEVDVLFLGRAHTGGDLEVYLPQPKILFMSEVFSNRIFPSMANGYPSEWIATLRKAERLAPAWFVPAHGFVDTAAILSEEERNYRAAIERIVAEGTRLHDRGVDVETAAAGAVLEPYDAWTRAGNNAYQAIKRVYTELDGGLQ
ncbi:MAG TPA: MBL fold metallo-hydrolase [Vicinamibacterales bacterium]|nr:MBL fold metallo-hydrolase [Vicinamibacterales bacterium]